MEFSSDLTTVTSQFCIFEKVFRNVCSKIDLTPFLPFWHRKMNHFISKKLCKALLRGKNLNYLPLVRNYQCDGKVYGFNALAWKRKKEEALSKFLHWRHQKFSILFWYLGDINVNFEARAQNPNLYRFIEAYRKHGHKCSKINPVPVRPVSE